MVAFKVAEIYPAHVPDDPNPPGHCIQSASFSQTIDSLGKPLYFNLLLQSPRDTNKLVFLLYQLS